MESHSNSVIVGSGLVGSLASIYLAKRGFNVNVFEQRSDIRKAAIYGGRSINLALSTRGWTALEKVGVDQPVKDISIPMYGRQIHNLDGTQTYQPYGKEGQAIYSVSRGDLNKALIDIAEKEFNVKFHFNQRIHELNLDTQSLLVENAETKEKQNVQSDFILGADGAYSMVRYSMQKLSRFNYSQEYLSHSYKELLIPAGADGSYLIEKNALHIWPRGHFMFIALPNFDGSFTCTLFAPFEGKDSFSEITSEEKVMQYFETYFKDVIPLIPDIKEQFLNNPTSHLVMVRCYPWNHKNVALIGDSAHAIVPFYGQGMNAGFEDVRVLDELLEDSSLDYSALLQRFSMLRKQEGDAILDLALYNFIEMRDLVAQPEFLFRKKIEAHLHEHLGNDFLPLYSMVTFSNIPYSQALQQGKRYDKMMMEMLALPDIQQIWNTDITVNFAKKWLEENPS